MMLGLAFLNPLLLWALPEEAPGMLQLLLTLAQALVFVAPRLRHRHLRRPHRRSVAAPYLPGA